MWRSAGLTCCLLAAGCSSEAEVRPQLVVVVDTDAPLVSQLADDPLLSPEATVDTLRIDIIDGLEPIDSETFPQYDLRNWPLSFGLKGEPGQVFRVRLRAFQAKNAEFGLQDGQPVRDPDRSTTIDRLAEVVIPTTGVERVKLVMSLGCMGRVAQFSPASTCIDETQPLGALGDGIEPTQDDAGPSRAGTHPFARDVPCDRDPPVGSVCIPGGFSLMGSRALVGIADTLNLDAAPLQPIWVAPFFMDEAEVSVSRFRTVADLLVAPPPTPPDPTNPNVFCTWFDDPSNELLPINCVRWDTALEACERLGGTLPTEAQWERAASGRGENRAYPWGEAAADCCAVQASYAIDCQGVALVPSGSHADPANCDGRADVTRDGVFDMAGNVAEWVADAPAPFGRECWFPPGLRVDPLCDDPSEERVIRGASAFSGFATTLVAWRRRALIDFKGAGVGFRCVYPDAS